MADNNEIPYSEDDVFEQLIDKDQTVEIVGYVEAIEGRRNVKNYVFYKFTLTNGSKRVTCLIWGDTLINKHQSDITIGRILCLDGAKCKACILNYQRQENKFVPFELIIQSNTIVTFLGQHQSPSADSIPVAQEVDFEQIGKSEGLISIDGYLKTVFAQVPSQYQNMSYGCGSITNGIYKINVQVTNFIPVEMQKGQAVRVCGTVNADAVPLRIECQNMSDITITEGQPPMPLRHLLRGVRIPRRQRDN